MPDISISSATYERLKRYAAPFVDTPETVINRALDALAALDAQEDETDPDLIPSPERPIDVRALPDLTHTKVLSAAIDGQSIVRANWKNLVNSILRRAVTHAEGFEKARALLPLNMVKGRKEVDGFVYLADIDISVQGQDSNSACRTVITGAQSLGLALDIAFMWRHKEGAAYPGELARIVLAGTKPVKTR